MALNETALRALIDGLKDDLSALPLKISADNDNLTSQISRIGSTNIIQSYRLKELLITNNALVIKISNAQKALNNLSSMSGDATTQLAVDVLVVQINCANVSFDILLATYVPYFVLFQTSLLSNFNYKSFSWFYKRMCQ